jgi:hypothetical protein
MMARPSNTPRLAQIDPTALAAEVTADALSHIASQHMSLCGMLEGGLVLPAPERTEIYRTVRLLAGYARGDHALDAPVQEYLISLIALWSAPLVDPSSIGEIGLDTELGVVIHAAEGREELARDRGALTTLQLAAIAGMAQESVALLCRRGEIEADQEKGGWRVRAAEARRWLAARSA